MLCSHSYSQWLEQNIAQLLPSALQWILDNLQKVVVGEIHSCPVVRSLFWTRNLPDNAMDWHIFKSLEYVIPTAAAATVAPAAAVSPKSPRCYGVSLCDGVNRCYGVYDVN